MSKNNAKHLAVNNTPFDYSDNRIEVYFEVAAKAEVLELFKQFDFIEQENIKEEQYGWTLLICNQHIPEVVKVMVEANHAIYQIKRK